MNEIITYVGAPRFAQIAIDEAMKDITPEHVCRMTAPTTYLTLSNRERLMVLAYHTAKSGIKIRCVLQKKKKHINKA